MAPRKSGRAQAKKNYAELNAGENEGEPPKKKVLHLYGCLVNYIMKAAVKRSGPKTCKHCGKKISAAKFDEECKATKMHSQVCSTGAPDTLPA